MTKFKVGDLIDSRTYEFQKEDGTVLAKFQVEQFVTGVAKNEVHIKEQFINLTEGTKIVEVEGEHHE